MEKVKNQMIIFLFIVVIIMFFYMYYEIASDHSPVEINTEYSLEITEKWNRINNCRYHARIYGLSGIRSEYVPIIFLSDCDKFDKKIYKLKIK